MDIKKYTNEHGKFNQFDKYSNIFKKEKEEKPTLVADISQKDIDLSKAKGYSTVDLDTALTLSGNPTLTQDELNKLKAAAKKKETVEPTGKYKNE